MSEKLLNTLSSLGLQESLLLPLPEQALRQGWSIDSALLHQALLPEEALLEALSKTTGLKPVNLNHFYPDFSLAKLLLPEWCLQHSCVPLCEEDEALHVAVGYPPQLQALEEFSLHVGRKLLPWIAIQCRIQQWLSTLYALPLPPHFLDLLEKLSQVHAAPTPPPDRACPPFPPPSPAPSGAMPPPLAPSLPRRMPKQPASNVFRDFFVKIKQQLFPRQEMPPPPPPAPDPLPPVPPPPPVASPTEASLPYPPEAPTLTPTQFLLVDEGIHPESWLEELLAHSCAPPPARPHPRREALPPPLPAALTPSETGEHPALPWVISFRNNAAEPPNWTLDEAKEQLLLAQHQRDTLTNVILQFGLCAFEFVGLFSVIHGAAHGFACAGKGAQEGFLRTKIELASPGLFLSISQTLSAYFGPPPNEPRVRRFLVDIHRRPRSIFLFPIAVGDKLVAIFYGDSGQNPLKQKQFSEFSLFCQQIPNAFGALLKARRQHLPAPLSETALTEHISNAISQLLHADVASQNAALEILGHTPEASAQALIQHFPGPQSNLSNEDEAYASLHTLGPIAHALLQLGNAGVRVLTPLLSSPDKPLRCAALKLAGIFASPEFLEPVSLALLDAEPKIAAIARAVLPHFKTLQEWPKVLHLIQHSLHVKDPLRRSLAAKAVVAAKDRDSIPMLIEWTGDLDVWVAETAAWALQQLSCIQLGPSPNLWQRWWLRAQHERRVQWLVSALESESLEQRKQAIDELAGAIGDNFNFVADAPEEVRQLPLQRWHQFVEQNPDFEL